MEDFVIVNCDGRMLAVPLEDTKSESKMRWWTNQDVEGDNQEVHNRAVNSWSRYKSLAAIYSQPPVRYPRVMASSLYQRSWIGKMLRYVGVK